MSDYRAWQAFIGDPRFPVIAAVLAETVEKETVVFADALTYPR